MIDRRGFFGMLAGIFVAPAIAAHLGPIWSPLEAHLEEQPEPEITTTEVWGTTGTVTVHYADGEYYDYNGQLIQGTYTGGVACS